MNKEQAAKRIGVSVRTLQRHMSAHRIAFTMKRTKTGEVADFDREEVERFKRELKEGLTAAVNHGVLEASEAVRAIAPDEAASQQTALAPLDQMQRFAALMRSFQPTPTKPASAVAIESKLMLSLAEASELSGISVARLREAVHSGKLAAHKGIGRGLGKVKRDDLLAYVRKL
jgi:excisionase family DNA binding protein